MKVLQQEEVVDVRIGKIYCNKCGKEINCMKEDYLACDTPWGYFSDKDGELHSFDLCESCYDTITADFKIPVSINTIKVLI